MSRVHLRLPGLLAARAARTDEAAYYRAVHVHAAARRALRNQLGGTGRWRSGLLFGDIVNEVMHIRYVAAAAPDFAWWSTSQAVFPADEGYALGWVDALAAASARSVEWLGIWIIHAHSQRATLTEDLALLYGERDGLFNDHQLLMSTGWAGDRLVAAAYRLMDGEAEVMEVVWPTEDV